MEDIIFTFLAAAILIVIAMKMWEKDWWGKIISIICVGAAIRGLLDHIWVIIIVAVIAIMIYSNSKKE